MNEVKRSYHPGETIWELMEDHGYSFSQLETLMGIEESDIRQVVFHEAPIRWSFAYRLHGVFGISVEFWMNLQAMYDMYMSSVNQQNKITYKVVEAKDNNNKNL